LGNFEKGNILAVLSASRSINWVEQPFSPILAAPSATSGLPSSVSSGVDMEDSVKCLVGIYVREKIHQRTVRFTVPIHDAATTYNANIAGTPISYVNGADVRADQALRGLQGLMSASVPILAVATPTVLNASGVDVTGTPFDGSDSETIAATAATTLILRGVNPANYAVDFSFVGGTGTIVVVADPVTCSVRGYVTRKVSASASEWVLVNGLQADLDARNWTERLTVNGYRRIYFEVYNVTAPGDGAAVTYAPGIFVGPAILE